MKPFKRVTPHSQLRVRKETNKAAQKLSPVLAGDSFTLAHICNMRIKRQDDPEH